MKKFKNTNKYGYMDENKMIIIPPRFDDAHEFSEGVAGVEVNGMWGFIDQLGAWVIQPRFDYVQKFLNGIVMVLGEGKRYSVSKEGNVLFSV